MIIKPVYTTESIEERKLDDFDEQIIESLIETYGSDELFNILNEVTYYGSSGRFDRTGGSRVSGVKGFLQALPSFAMTSIICWPIALIAGLGAISARIRHKYEDRDSWLNRLNPRFWVDYLGSPSHKKEKSSSSSEKKDGWFKRNAKTALGVAGGALAGAAATSYLKDKKKDSSTDSSIDSSTSKSIDSDTDVVAFTPGMKEYAINKIIVPYWVTLSNGEILRIRSDSEENAKTMANMIISYTTKPCYEKLNELIDKGYPRYKFYFDDGEICYWSAISQSLAYAEAVKTRKDLCNAMNNVMGASVKLEDLDMPKVDGKVEVERGKKIEIPKLNKFKSITRTQPHRPNEQKDKLPNPAYKYGSLYNYRTGFANFSLNMPGYTENDAKDITRDFNSRTAYSIIQDVYNDMNKRYDLYRVTMADGDIYVLPDQKKAQSTAMKLHQAKIESIKNVLTESKLEEFEDFMTDYGTVINSIKNCKLIDPSEGKNYTLKKANEATLVMVKEANGKNIKYNNFIL